MAGWSEAVLTRRWAPVAADDRRIQDEFRQGSAVRQTYAARRQGAVGISSSSRSDKRLVSQMLLMWGGRPAGCQPRKPGTTTSGNERTVDHIEWLAGLLRPGRSPRMAERGPTMPPCGGAAGRAGTNAPPNKATPTPYGRWPSCCNRPVAPRKPSAGTSVPRPPTVTPWAGSPAAGRDRSRRCSDTASSVRA